MRKFFRKAMCCILVLCLTLGLTGCTTYNNFKAAFFPDDPVAQEAAVKIGVYEAMSGQMSQQGKAEVMGIELAHELYPTVLGMNVELVYADNQSNMYVAETVIQELVSQKPNVILGSCGETVTLVAGDYIKAANIPAITISSTNPLITSNNDFYFSATFTETRQGDALADYAYTSREKELVATVKTLNDDSATATIKRFTNRMKKLSGNQNCVVGEYNLLMDSTDYTSVIEAIRDSGARAVFLDVPAATAQDFLKQAVNLNMTNITWLGVREWNTEEFIKFASEQPDLDIAFTSDFSHEAATDMSAEFLQAYKDKYGEAAEPAEATAVAFDAYLLAIHAIERAHEVVMETTEEDLQKKYGESEAALKGAVQELEQAQQTGIPTGRHIRMALEGVEDFAGASGMISYNGKNEATKTISINHIAGGEVKDVYNVG